MLIGLTYDLRSEYLAAGHSEEAAAAFDREETLVALEAALHSLGHSTARIGHARALVANLAAGERWDLVFNLAEGLHGVAREAQVPAILDVYGIAYTFSDPLVMALTLHKALTKTVVRAAGIPTPDFVVIEHVDAVAAVELPFPLFAKPVAEGACKGISAASKVADRAALYTVVAELLTTYQQPVLLETYLPGREFTVGLVGTGADAEVLGTLEIVLRAGAEPGAYTSANKERGEELVEHRLVQAQEDPAVGAAEQLALAAWKTLQCRDAGRVDLRCDASGAPSFLEVNPLAELHPTHSMLPLLATALGIPYEQLVGRIVGSASTRVLAH